jgi:hypothetical protein
MHNVGSSEVNLRSKKTTVSVVQISTAAIIADPGRFIIND